MEAVRAVVNGTVRNACMLKPCRQKRKKHHNNVFAFCGGGGAATLQMPWYGHQVITLSGIMVWDSVYSITLHSLPCMRRSR
jgi:hypothetical protein